MQDVERDMIKKSVEEIKCIKEQIECIKLLPIKEVHREVEEVVAKFFPIIEGKDKECEDMDSILGNLISDIQDTCLHMIRIRKKFRQKCPTLTLKRKLKMHNLTGLKRTLDSLEGLACSFNDRWKHYAPLFTPFYAIGVKKATNR
ncbi:unnamed protein product [Cuscuta europaea]|uniref:Uncharacterized protein n=1 Tax=Cuscuta europaea TaxID=41803 RepID=A0A9P0ZAE3_CUSEU|nr:unnamed protein product [Cuscuta europaea]